MNGAALSINKTYEYYKKKGIDIVVLSGKDFFKVFGPSSGLRWMTILSSGIHHRIVCREIGVPAKSLSDF